MKKEFIAHKREDGTEQSIKEHLKGTAERASVFASAFDAAAQGLLAGWAHDVGKYSDGFQKRILENGPRVDHATAGALECAKRNQSFAAFCVAGHHSGLPDMGGLDDCTENTLRARLTRALAGEIPDYSSWEKEVHLPDAKTPAYIQNDNSFLTNAFFIRMLYSCLVDADYLDTESFMNDQSSVRTGSVDLRVLERRLDDYIRNWFPPKGQLNEKRCAILQSCIDRHADAQGLYTLTVPTGGGKTVASLAFALKHATAHNLKRVIYVVPYTSIIEQTAEQFCEILGNENVLEHHSGIEYETDERINTEALKHSLATENWDMPVIVTTAVQFFESLFACKSSKCRKLHNIAGSVVVFDEAQMLPIPYLRPCVYAIAQLVRNYHVSAVLCTATQPALWDYFKEFMKEYKAQELCPQELTVDPVFVRTKIVRAGEMTWNSITGYMNQRHQILCIVNSRKNAQTLYGMLEKEGCYHLSTLMIPAHRKKTLDEIRARLKNGLVCRVVSTSLIEAGVDVDFPEVMREEAGLDSILQAAGRCNREGKRPLNESIVTVFRAENPPPILFSTNIGAANITMAQFENVASAQAIERYFKELFALKKTELDRKGIIEKINSGTYSFRSIAEQVHLIENDTVTVYVPIDEGEDLLSRMQEGETSRGLMRKLGQYSVNLYENHFQELRQSDDIRKINDTIWYLENTSLYSRETGLSLKADYGKAEFV